MIDFNSYENIVTKNLPLDVVVGGAGAAGAGAGAAGAFAGAAGADAGAGVSARGEYNC